MKGIQLVSHRQGGLATIKDMILLDWGNMVLAGLATIFLIILLNLGNEGLAT